MMEYRDGMFQQVLADCALFEVQKAFLEYIKRSSDLPTPSDILKLIEEDRKYRFVKEPDIETLAKYRTMGITLTANQEAILQKHYSF